MTPGEDRQCGSKSRETAANQGGGKFCVLAGMCRAKGKVASPVFPKPRQVLFMENRSLWRIRSPTRSLVSPIRKTSKLTRRRSLSFSPFCSHFTFCLEPMHLCSPGTPGLLKCDTCHVLPHPHTGHLQSHRISQGWALLRNTSHVACD